MPTLVLVATVLFSTQLQCMQHQYEQVVTRPIYTNITYRNVQTAILELYGGRAVLQCKGREFSAWILEDKDDWETIKGVRRHII